VSLHMDPDSWKEAVRSTHDTKFLKSCNGVKKSSNYWRIFDANTGRAANRERETEGLQIWYTAMKRLEEC
jgi:hypothetical protein